MLDWLDKNIQLSNINEVCVVLIVTVFSIGFPIFYQAKEKIADNFKSQALLKFFNKKKYFSSFITVLILSLLSLLPWVLNVEPLFNMNNFLINNSAKFLIIFFTTLLVVKLFILIKRFSIFSNSNDLFNYLKKEYYKESKKTNFQKKLEFIISKLS